MLVSMYGLIIPALLWKPTRKLAFIASIIFHLFNSFIFQVGIFPYLSLAFAVFFFDPKYIQNLFLKKKPFYNNEDIKVPNMETRRPKGKKVRNQTTQTDTLPKAVFQEPIHFRTAHYKQFITPSIDLREASSRNASELGPVRKTWGRNTAGLPAVFQKRVDSPYKLKLNYFPARKAN